MLHQCLRIFYFLIKMLRGLWRNGNNYHSIGPVAWIVSSLKTFSSGMEFEFFTDYFFACTFNVKSRFSLYVINNFKLDSITTVCPRHLKSIKLKLLKDEGEVISSSAFNHQMWKSKTYCNSLSCVAVIFVVRTCTRENDQMTLTISLGAFPVSSTHMADVVIF